MKRKQIIKIMQKGFEEMACREASKSELNYFKESADAILAIPLDVPSDGEIKKEIFKRTTEPVPYTGKNYIPKPVFQFMEEISKWVKDEIIKRNK